jgi:proteic killer suppression protein
MLKVEFRNPDLQRLEVDRSYSAGYPPEAVKKFRMRMQAIRAATNERDLYQLASWHFKRLKGDMAHLRSIRLNDQWRLIVEIKDTKPSNTIVIVAIVDPHH